MTSLEIVQNLHEIANDIDRLGNEIHPTDRESDAYYLRMLLFSFSAACVLGSTMVIERAAKSLHEIVGDSITVPS